MQEKQDLQVIFTCHVLRGADEDIFALGLALYPPRFPIDQKTIQYCILPVANDIAGGVSRREANAGLNATLARRGTTRRNISNYLQLRKRIMNFLLLTLLSKTSIHLIKCVLSTNIQSSLALTSLIALHLLDQLMLLYNLLSHNDMEILDEFSLVRHNTPNSHHLSHPICLLSTLFGLLEASNDILRIFHFFRRRRKHTVGNFDG